MKLQLPPRRMPEKSDFDTGASAFRQWVDDLPLVNADKTRELLESAIGGMNTLAIPPQERFEALELLATPVICTMDALKRSFLGRSIPLTGKALENAAACLNICKRMATGYEILAEDLEDDGAGKPLLMIAIHRALRYLSEELLTNYQVYIQHPEGLWRQIHTLYALAELRGITARPVTDITLPTTGSSAIDTVYRQILLLSLACPYHLRQNEIHYVYNALLDWADYSRLAGADNEVIHGLFAVNLEADRPPAYRALSSDTRTGDELRVLDTRDLKGRLQEVLSRQSDSPENRTGIGDTRTLQRLMLCWGVMPERRHTRQPREDEPVTLVVGLNNVHLLLQLPGRNSQNDNGPTEELADVPPLLDPTHDRPTRIATSKVIRDPFQRAMAETASKAMRGGYVASAPDNAHMETWKIADMSAGGYCLLHDSQQVSRARIGELVAVAKQQGQDAGDWQLGVVRWMKFSAERGLELGIQMLAEESAEAIWASVCFDSVSEGNRMQGILVSGAESAAQQDSLLLSAMPFRTGCTTILEKDAGKIIIKLTRQLENTGSFAQYHFAAEGDN